MWLFGPNIKKMIQRHDVERLVELSVSPKRSVRMKAIQGLAQLGDVEGLTRALVNQAQYSTDDHSMAVEIVSSIERTDAGRVLSQVITIVKDERFLRECFVRLKGLKAIDASSWIETAEVLLNGGQVQLAFACVDEAISVDPDNEGLANLTKALVPAFTKVKEASMARSCSATLRRLKTMDVASWLKAAVTFWESGRMDLVKNCVDEALRLEPGDERLLGWICQVLVEKEENAAALGYFDQWTKVAPDTGKAWAGRGLALMNLGKYEDAEESCLRALSIDPSLIGAKQLLISVYYGLRRFDDLIRVARESLQEDPNHVQGRVLLALALLHRDDPATAHVESEEALRIVSASGTATAADFHFVHRSLALSCLAQRQWDEAGDHIKEALEANPHDKTFGALREGYRIINCAIENCTNEAYWERRVDLLVTLASLRLRPDDDVIPLTTRLTVLKVASSAQLKETIETGDDPGEFADIVLDELEWFASALEKTGKLPSLVQFA